MLLPRSTKKEGKGWKAKRPQTEKLVALSIRQPWATLVVLGLKTVELRRWSTARRGSVLIHAGRLTDKSDDGWRMLPEEHEELAKLKGGVIGSAEIVGCVRYDDREELYRDMPLHLANADRFKDFPVYGFEIANARALPFRPCTGNLFFFAPSDLGES